MGNESRRRHALAPVGRALLLAPEAVPLAVLLCAYMAWQSTAAALLLALLALTFTIRVVALHVARALVERGRAGEAAALLAVARALYPWSPDALALEGVVALMIS